MDLITARRINVHSGLGGHLRYIKGIAAGIRYTPDVICRVNVRSLLNIDNSRSQSDPYSPLIT